MYILRDEKYLNVKLQNDFVQAAGKQQGAAPR